MKFKSIKALGKGLYEFGCKNSHIIAGVVGIGGVFLTGYLAFQARPKFDRVMKEQQEKMDELHETVELDDETKKKVEREITKETVKRLVPVLAPPVIAAVATSGSIGFSVKSGVKKITHATSRAIASELACQELYDKTREIVGDEKAQEIQKEIAQDQIDKQYGKDISDEKAQELYDKAFQAKGGNQLFYDPQFGRLFKSDDDTVFEVANELMGKFRRNYPSTEYIDYNEFYRDMELSEIVAGVDYALAWNDSFYENDLIGLTPKLGSTIKIGKFPVTVLHWADRPVFVKELLERTR